MLHNVFGEIAYDGVMTLDYLDFHTHGFPGGIALGSTHLDYDSVKKQFGSAGYDQVFAKDATIKFVGCNCAEDANGEFFLVRVAQAFLKRNGGTVWGNTGAGLNVGSDPPHPFGDWVKATIAAGGSTTLSGHTHLRMERIREREERLRGRLRTAEYACQPAEQLADAQIEMGSYYNAKSQQSFYDKFDWLMNFGLAILTEWKTLCTQQNFRWRPDFDDRRPQRTIERRRGVMHM